MSSEMREVQKAIKALARGQIIVDDALAISKQTPEIAEHEASMAFAEYSATGSAPDQSAQRRLMDLLWILAGPSSCIVNHFVHADRPLVESFLAEKLKKAPRDFSSQDVELAAHYYTTPQIQKLASELEARSLSDRAKELRGGAPETSADVQEVKKRVSRYRFNEELNDLLDKIESGLFSEGDQFDQAALLKHLRTFFEQLHGHVAVELRRQKPETVDGTNLSKCQQTIDYLQRNDLLTDKMQALGRALYGVLSNEGVHAIKAESEYVRLCRNMVAEYALVLFFELERRVEV